MHAAAHQHDLLHAVDDARLEAGSQRDVREGPGRHEGDRAGLFGHHNVDDELGRAALVERDLGLGQHGAVEPRLAVNVRRGLDGAHERPLRAPGERHARDTGHTGDGERVARHLFDRLVAHDRRDGEQVDVGAAMGEQHRDRVVMAGVAVEDDLLGHLLSVGRARPLDLSP